MTDQSKSYSQKMSPDLLSGITSPGSAAGVSPSALLDGRIAGPLLPGRARASRSRKQAKVAVRVTSGIYGPTCFESSVDFAAQPGWVSRSAERLATVGSMEFVLTWRAKVTPSGRSIFRLAASRPRTSEPGSIGLPQPDGYPTPRASEAGADFAKRDRSLTGMALPALAAEMVGYPTPNTHPEAPNMSKTRENGRIANRETEQCLGEVAKQLDLIAFRTPSASDALLVAHPNPDAQAGAHSLTTEATMLSSWASPSARDHKDTPGMATEATNPDGSARDRTDQLPRQVAAVVSLTARPSARAEDSECCGNHPGAMDSLTGVTRVLSGQTTPLSDPIQKENTDVLAADSKPSKKSSAGALSPTFVSWLMGYPSAWLECAPEKKPQPRFKARKSKPMAYTGGRLPPPSMGDEATNHPGRTTPASH